MSVDLTRVDLAEEFVIGAMITSSRYADEGVSLLRAADFADPEMAALFQAVVDVRQEDPTGRVDWYRVAAAARTFKDTQLVDLQRLRDATPIAENLSWYARVILDRSQRRSLQLAAARIATAATEAATGGDALAAATQALSEATSVGAGDRMIGKTWEEIRDTPNVLEDWVVPDYLERGDRLVVTGGEGAGKSYFLRYVAMMTAAGLSFVDHEPIDPRRVLVVDVENSEKRWRDSMSGLDRTIRHEGHDINGQLHIECTGRLDITSPKDLIRIHQLIAKHQPDLMTIGPLYKLTPRGINNDDDAAPVITALDSIREQGVTLCLETHMGHGKGANGDRDVRPRGSAALMGWPENGLGFAPTPLSEEWTGDPREIMEWIRWRGDRAPRNWPRYWTRGGKWPLTRWEAPGVR